MKIEQPCVAIKLKNLYDIQYLLDSNNNIVFCTTTGINNYEIMSYNIELLKEHIAQNKYVTDPYYYYYRKKYTHNCKGMRTEDINLNIGLNKKFEEFAPLIFNINDNETLNQYKLSEINLDKFVTTDLYILYKISNIDIDKFVTTELYKQYKSSNIDLDKFVGTDLYKNKYFEKYKNENFDKYYKSIPDTNNNNFPYDKKHFVITLLFHFLFNYFIPKLNELEKQIINSRELKSTGSNENEVIKNYYLKNKIILDEYIDILTDFKKVFVIKEEKKAKSEEEKKTEGNNTIKIISIVVPISIFVILLILFFIFRKRIMNYTENIKLSSLTSKTHSPVVTRSDSAKAQRLAYEEHLLK